MTSNEGLGPNLERFLSAAILTWTLLVAASLNFSNILVTGLFLAST